MKVGIWMCKGEDSSAFPGIECWQDLRLSAVCFIESINSLDNIKLSREMLWPITFHLQQKKKNMVWMAKKKVCSLQCLLFCSYFLGETANFKWRYLWEAKSEMGFCFKNLIARFAVSWLGIFGLSNFNTVWEWSHQFEKDHAIIYN